VADAFRDCEITGVHTVAVGRSIRNLQRLRKLYGTGRWRKTKGVASELHKIYRVVADGRATVTGDLRIIDESGEDYLYPAAWFAAVELPRRVRTSLLRRSARLQSA
jgi:hypothetical protein